MRSLRHVAVWLLALAVLLAGPVATLGECLRCPPDCPMHVQRDARADHDPAAHAHHGGHGDDAVAAAHAVAPADHDCHRAPAPAESEGPCLSGVCGHMDPTLARALPDGVLRRPSAVAPGLACDPVAPAPAARPMGRAPEPPTEPPRSRLA